MSTDSEQGKRAAVLKVVTDHLGKRGFTPAEVNERIHLVYKFGKLDRVRVYPHNVDTA